MRFLHTSDWHLGRIFYGIHLTQDQSEILDQFIDLIKDVRPDAVVIAGDIYDRSVPPIEAVELLDDVLSRIVLSCQVPVIIIAGNHDSPERLGFGNRLLSRQGLHVFGQIGSCLEPVVLQDSFGPVYFVPLVYAEPAIVRQYFGQAEITSHEDALRYLMENFLGQIPVQSRKVAIAHAYVAGGLAGDSERPLSVGGAGTVSPALFSPFNYTALGHLHQSQQVGQDTLRYSGSLLKYSFSEATQRKGITLVELSADGAVKYENIQLKPRRDMSCLTGYLRDLLAKPDAIIRDNYISVTLLDKELLLDPMGQLRQVYPNLLQIERENIIIENELGRLRADHRRMSEQEIFAAFYAQVTGETLSDRQVAILAGVIEKVYRESREVEA